MKAIFAAFLSLALVAGPMAQAQTTVETQIETPVSTQVEIPAQVNDEQSLMELLNSLYAVQLTELTLLEAQQKYFEIMRASFQASHALSQAFDAEAAQAGAKVGAGGVTLVMDAYIARMWLRGATPSFIALKDIYHAARGQQARMSQSGLSTLTAIRELGTKVAGGSVKVLGKRVVSTVAIGAFAYIQLENFWVINMSPAQYNAVIASLDMKIAKLAARQAAIADTRAPIAR